MNRINIFEQVSKLSETFYQKDHENLCFYMKNIEQSTIYNSKPFEIQEKKEVFKNKCYDIITQYFEVNNEDIPEYMDFFWNFFKAIEYQSKNNFTESFNCLNEAYNSFTRLFKDQEGIWLLIPLKMLTQILRIYSIRDCKVSKSDESAKKAINSIRGLLSLMNLSKAAPRYSKKRGLIFSAKELGYLCFYLKKYMDCNKNINDAVEFLSLPEINAKDFSKSDLIHVTYYKGRIALFEMLFVKAADSLEESFRGSYFRSIKNQRVILKYLIPAKLFCGQFPTVELLNKFKLYEYVLLTKAIYEGNIHLFKGQLLKYRNIWIKRGLYIVLEKLEIVLIRNLIKRVHKICNKTVLDTDHIKDALNFSSKQISFDIDETECIIGNLILKGYIKGYVSHEKRKIVFSQSEPFPKFQKLISNNSIV